jgi:hypothetical protein
MAFNRLLRAVHCVGVLPAAGNRPPPKMIVCDNGTELTSNVILQWADDHKVAWHYIAPGNRCSFDPETTQVMSSAFEKACANLGLQTEPIR